MYITCITTIIVKSLKHISIINYLYIHFIFECKSTFLYLSFSLTFRLFKWARTSWGRGRSTWPTFGPANGRALQQLTCPSAWNKPRGSAPLPGLAGWPRLAMCTAMPPHSVQEPHAATLSNSKSWHSVVIGSHHGVPTYQALL